MRPNKARATGRARRALRAGEAGTAGTATRMLRAGTATRVLRAAKAAKVAPPGRAGRPASGAGGQSGSGGQGGAGGQSGSGGQGGRQDWGRGDQRGNAAGEADPNNRSRRRRRGRDRGPEREIQAQERGADLPFTGEPVDVEGFLDLRDEGFGFLRTEGFKPGPRDVYVSVSQVRRFGLRKGDYLVGASRPANPGEKFPALLRIDTVGGMTPDEARQRPRFEDLTPLFPDEKLRMETPGDPTNVTARIVDLMCPIGKGQRGLIVSPPKAGKTTVIKQIAKSIETNNPEVHLIVLLVDERPEEVTDMRRTVKGEVIVLDLRPAGRGTHPSR